MGFPGCKTKRRRGEKRKKEKGIERKRRIAIGTMECNLRSSFD